MQTENIRLMDAALFASSVETAGAERVALRWKGKSLRSVDLGMSRLAMDSAGHEAGTETFTFSFRAFPKEVLGIPKNSLIEERYPTATHAVLVEPPAVGISMDHPEPYVAGGEEGEDCEGEGYFPPDEDFAFQELEGFLGGVPWRRFEFLMGGDPDDREWAGRRCWRMVPETEAGP